MEIVHEEGIAASPASADSPTRESGSLEVHRGARKAIENATSRLGLTPQQVSATTPIFIRAGQKMAKLPKLSPERDNVFQQFYEELQPHLNEQQKILSKEFLEKHLKQSPTA